MLKYIIYLFVLSAGVAQAQQAQQPTPHDQAMGQRLLNEINASIQCETKAIALQQELSTAQVRVKELETKYEPKPAEKK